MRACSNMVNYHGALATRANEPTHVQCDTLLKVPHRAWLPEIEELSPSECSVGEVHILFIPILIRVTRVLPIAVKQLLVVKLGNVVVYSHNVPSMRDHIENKASEWGCINCAGMYYRAHFKCAYDVLGNRKNKNNFKRGVHEYVCHCHTYDEKVERRVPTNKFEPAATSCSTSPIHSNGICTSRNVHTRTRVQTQHSNVG